MSYQKVKVSIHKNTREKDGFKYTSIDESTYQYSILMETRGDRGRGLRISPIVHHPWIGVIGIESLYS